MAPQEYFDLFISYAAVDNDYPAPRDQWVSRFDKALRQVLKAQLGDREPRIYFDKRVTEANDRLEEILTACRKSKLFLAVSSPAYHVRSWTRRELEAFAAVQSDPNCIFVVELDKSDPKLDLEPIKHRHVMRFYEESSSNDANTSLPIAPDSDPFSVRIWALARSICKQLKETTIVNPPKNHSKPVLLAQVTEDLEDERNLVRSHLEQFGYTVLPDDSYPQGGADFKAAYTADLNRCCLVVQLLGPRFGRTPPDLKEGYGACQLEVAERALVPLMQWRRSNFNINETDVPNEAQRRLLYGSGVVASTLEQFKSAVVERLQKLNAEPGGIEKSHTSGPFTVFINTENSHRSIAEKIKDALRTQCAIALPPEKASGSIRKEFTKLLGDCHGLLLLHGDDDSPWTINQLRYAQDIRGDKPLLGAVCYGPGASTSIGFYLPQLVDLECKDETGSEWSFEAILKSFPAWAAAHRESSRD